MHATLNACFRGAAAIATVFSLLRRAVDSAWSATASRLGADLAGLHGVSGEYDLAIRCFRQMAPASRGRTRPSDVWNLTIEAAHAYTMIVLARPCRKGTNLRSNARRLGVSLANYAYLFSMLAIARAALDPARARSNDAIRATVVASVCLSNR
jgi:hypothetical protein